MPQLCLQPEHEHLRELVSPALGELVAGAQRSGLAALVPKTVIETDLGALGPFPQGANTLGFSFDLEAISGAAMSKERLIGKLLTPWACPAVYDEGLDAVRMRAFDDLSATWASAAGADPRNVGSGTGAGKVLTPQQAASARETLFTCV